MTNEGRAGTGGLPSAEATAATAAAASAEDVVTATIAATVLFSGDVDKGIVDSIGADRELEVVSLGRCS